MTSPASANIACSDGTMAATSSLVIFPAASAIRTAASFIESTTAAGSSLGALSNSSVASSMLCWMSAHASSFDWPSSPGSSELRGMPAELEPVGEPMHAVSPKMATTVIVRAARPRVVGILIASSLSAPTRSAPGRRQRASPSGRGSANVTVL